MRERKKEEEEEETHVELEERHETMKKTRRN